MAGPKAPTPGDYTFPANQATASGVIGIGLVALLVVLIGVDGWSLPGVRVQLGLLIFGVLTWALMLRPKILVRQGLLLLVNPFHRVVLPLRVVDFVEVRAVTKVHVGERTYVGIAVGRKTRAMARSRSAGGAFGITPGGDAPEGDTPRSGDQTPELLEEWVNQAAVDARREAERTNTPDSTEGAIRRTPNLPLFAVLAVLVVALVVALLV